jgi:hypothetical protein
VRRLEWKTAPQVRIAYGATRKSLPTLPVFDALDTVTRDLVAQMWERGMMFGLLHAASKTEQ